MRGFTVKYLSFVSLAWLPLFFLTASSAWAESCEGGAYLNPQTIRGEAQSVASLADAELLAVLARTGLPTQPLQVIKRADSIKTLKKPPCWIFGNPVVGLSNGYRAAVVNTESIQPAVLLIGDAGAAKDATPVLLSSLPDAQKTSLLERLKKTKCFGIASGVTTSVVKAEGICASVEEVTPHSGLGQSFLATKAGFEWDERHWVGFITRDSSALRTSMKGVIGKSSQLGDAKLVVIPAKAAIFGYGLYLHASVSEADAKKSVAAFMAISTPTKGQIIALDLGAKFKFAVPSPDQVQQAATAIGVTLAKTN
jgi:hypothetical protein